MCFIVPRAHVALRGAQRTNLFLGSFIDMYTINILLRSNVSFCDHICEDQVRSLVGNTYVKNINKECASSGNIDILTQ